MATTGGGGGRGDHDVIPLEAEPERPRPSRPVGIGGAPGAAKHAGAGGQKRAAVPGPSCPKCGYSLVGLRADRCPECGGPVANLLALQRKAKAAKELRAAYWRSAAWVGGSWLVVAVLLAIQGNYIGIPLYFLGSAVMVGVGFGVFVACSAVWIGFDQPLGVSVLRLAAIYAIVDAVVFLAALLPGGGGTGFLSWLVSIVIYYTLLSRWLELEGRDAFLVAFFTSVAKTLLYFVL